MPQIAIKEFTEWLDKNLTRERRILYFAPERMLRELDVGGVYWVPMKDYKLERAIINNVYEDTSAVPGFDVTEYEFVTILSGKYVYISNRHVDFQIVDKNSITARRHIIALKGANTARSLIKNYKEDRRRRLHKAIKRGLTLTQKLKLMRKKSKTR